MAREIICIPARPETNPEGGSKTKKIRLAAYCRVSSQNEDQLFSFENQVTYYRNYAKDNPKYELVDIYADEGISGMQVRHRLEFQRMIQDCQEGKIDMVITKSVTRFARNTQDCLNYARQLKDLGIGVFFEKENINTLDSTGELLFTILASLAQDECRSISENTKWGIRSLYRQGVLHLNTNNFLGYDKDANGKLIINEREAEIVRRIYNQFLDGYGTGDIARNLLEEKVPGVYGKCKWHSSTIFGILRNEKYMGDALCQKTYVADYLTGRMAKNNGEIEQVLIRKNHEPIIPLHIWKAVQQELNRFEEFQTMYKVRNKGHVTESYPFSSKLICGVCGMNFTLRTWYREKKPIKVWQCRSKYQQKGVKCCGNGNFHDRKLVSAFEHAWQKMLQTKDVDRAERERKMREGNELEAFRAEQMIKSLESWPAGKKPDNLLIMKVLSHLVFLRGHVEFVFRDGAKVSLEISKK